MSASQAIAIGTNDKTGTGAMFGFYINYTFITILTAIKNRSFSVDQFFFTLF